MHHRRFTRRLLAAFIAVTVVAGTGGATAAADERRGDDKGRQQAHRELEKDRKARERARREPAIVEAKGAVTAVDATAKTFEMQVSQANRAGLRGKKVTFVLAPKGFVSINERPATLADVKVGDHGKVQGLPAADGKVTAYVARFSRRAPVPAKIHGTIVTTDPLVLFARGMNVPIQMATPSILTLNDAVATVSELEPGDRCSGTGIPTATGLVIFHLACIRP